MKEAGQTFVEVVAGLNQVASSAMVSKTCEEILVTANQPRLERGNIMVEIDEGEYKSGVFKNQFSVIVRIFIQESNREAIPNDGGTLSQACKLMESKRIQGNSHWEKVFSYIVEHNGGSEPYHEYGSYKPQTRGVMGVRI